MGQPARTLVTRLAVAVFLATAFMVPACGSVRSDDDGGGASADAAPGGGNPGGGRDAGDQPPPADAGGSDAAPDPGDAGPDPDDAGVCGSPGDACCAGQPECLGDFVECQAGTCEECGNAPLAPCCQTGPECNPELGLSCILGTCQI